MLFYLNSQKRWCGKSTATVKQQRCQEWQGCKTMSAQQYFQRFSCIWNVKNKPQLPFRCHPWLRFETLGRICCENGRSVLTDWIHLGNAKGSQRLRGLGSLTQMKLWTPSSDFQTIQKKRNQMSIFFLFFRHLTFL